MRIRQLAFLLAFPLLSACGASLELQSVEKIWDQGAHNAFTDLIRFKGRFYCTFRESEAHVGGDGTIRVISSSDGKNWKPVALIAEQGTDLRDPKFSVAPDGRLMIVAGGSIYGGTKVLKGRQPRVMFSKDGKTWSTPRKILSEGEWLWRVTWYKGRAYGVSYNHTPAGAKLDERGRAPEWLVTLFESGDGISWQELAKLNVPGQPNETTLRFLPHGEMMAFVRREGGDKQAWIGKSSAPYKEWEWKPSGHQVGGPNFFVFPDGRIVGGGRDYRTSPKYTTAIGMLTASGYTPEVQLPSAGDNSYPGFVWYANQLWTSYYSSHEGKTSIYLAKLKMKQ